MTQRPRRGLFERLQCYGSLGGMSGVVACLLAVLMDILVRYVEWWQPIEDIDVVPDLVVPSPSYKKSRDKIEI